MHIAVVATAEMRTERVRRAPRAARAWTGGEQGQVQPANDTGFVVRFQIGTGPWADRLNRSPDELGRVLNHGAPSIEVEICALEQVRKIQAILGSASTLPPFARMQILCP